MDVSFEPHQRLCYYPSCHYHTPWILLDLDCDLFIMSEQDRRSSTWRSFRASFERHGRKVELIEETPRYLHFLSDGKPVWVFREDNRQTLARIEAAGLKIHHFVGIRDGCMEGGNHECVNERPFLSHLLPLAAIDMRYTTDHMPPLQLSWERRRKFRSGAWLDFCASEPSRQAPVSDARLREDIRFDLQGVLVKEGDHLHELRFGEEETELRKMHAFRRAHGIGILAEYRVRIPDLELELLWLSMGCPRVR